jgi:FlaA1/EpsC-like NDP-sugar epimerase
MTENMNQYREKRVLVTGACGTIGRELVWQLLTDYRVGELICLDNNESELFFLEQRFSKVGNSRYFLADIRDREKLSIMMREVDTVFHAAAYKHVILCERSPYEAVQTNILGVRNVIQAASENKVKRVIFTSSDKAVNPTNVMGASKLMGERLITASAGNTPGCVMASTRFGNVMGSRGSVLPIFREQIRLGGPVTVTHPDMTRFVMSIAHAVKLVVDSANMARGGEVFITKMPALRILDLAEIMIRELAPVFGHDPAAIRIELIGTKPGEKMFEELINSEESRRARELGDYFVILPALSAVPDEPYPGELSQSVEEPYHSGNCPLMTKDDITEFLSSNNLLSALADSEPHPAQRHWG